jgi:ferric enterobactin receptor
MPTPNPFLILRAMNYSLKLNSLLFLATLGLPLSLTAQTAPASRATVTGTAVDGGAKAEPLPFATVLLRHAEAGDTSLVASGQTALDGKFELPQVPAGAYRLRVLAMGYQSLAQAVRVAPGQPSVALGLLKLRSATQRLGEVTVTGQKAVVQQELGKTIINVEKDLSSVGGTAVNVLENVPAVAVDASGTVSLRGSSNLTILIDGKPAGTSNGGPGPRLDQIPASQIAQVEVMTNPSAKYDASGAGVINIITKKNKQEGWNGQAALVVGTRDKYSPSLSLSRHHGKATWNLGYDGRDQIYRNRSNSQQTALLTDTPTPSSLYTTQDGAGTQHNRNHSLNLGLNYELNKEQTLSLSVQPHWEHQTELDNQTLTQQTLGSPTVTTQYGQSVADVKVTVIESSADYRHIWEAHKDRELTANAGMVAIDANIPVSQLLTGGTKPAGFRQEQAVNAKIYFGQVDYTLPSADGKGKLEVGLKNQVLRNTGSTAMLTPVSTDPSAEFVRDAQRSFDYGFTQVMPAAYATYSQQLPHGWSAQGGLRTEATFLNGSVALGAGASVNRQYISLFPSATVARELGKEAGQSRLQFSYARRLNRPDFMQQLPIQLYQDPRNYRQGNANLLPEFSHNLELGHQLNLANGASITSTVFARFTQNAIQRVRSIDEQATTTSNVGVVTRETYANLGSTTNLGLEMTWAQPLAKWWRVSASGSLYRSEIAANALNTANRAALAGTARLANNFTPRKGLDVQLTGNVRSTVLTAQGRQLPTGSLDVAVRQRLFGERAALTLRVSDLLNTQVRRTELATPELQTALYNKYETRVGWLGFTWYIGATKAKAGRIEAAPSGGGGFGG